MLLVERTVAFEQDQILVHYFLAPRQFFFFLLFCFFLDRHTAYFSVEDQAVFEHECGFFIFWQVAVRLEDEQEVFLCLADTTHTSQIRI